MKIQQLSLLILRTTQSFSSMIKATLEKPHGEVPRDAAACPSTTQWVETVSSPLSTVPNAHQVQETTGSHSALSQKLRHTHTHTTCSSYYLMSIPKSHLADPPSSLCAKPIHTGVIIVDRNQFGLAEKEASQGKKKFQRPTQKCKGWTLSESRTWPPVSTPTKKACKCYALWAVLFSPLH